MVLLSLKELFELHKAGFIAAGICLVLIIVAIILLIVRHNMKNGNPNATDEEKLIFQTLKEEKQEAEEQEASKAQESNEVKEEAKPQEEKKEEVKALDEEKKSAKQPEEKTVKTNYSMKSFSKEARGEEEKVVEQKPKQEAKKEETKKDSKPSSSKIKQAPKKEPVKEEVKEVEKTEEAEAEKKSRTLMGKYEIYFDGSRYFYKLKASNGEVLITSETYASKENVYNAIEAVKRSISDGRVLVAPDKHGLYQFALLAKNHRKVAMSANYPSEKGAIRASESFKRFAANANIEEIKEPVESLKEEIKFDDIVDKKGGKIGVVKGNDVYYYQLVASNGVVLINSDNYSTAELANSGLETFKESMNSGRFFIERDKRDMYQFKVYTQGGRLIVASETYSTKANAISACKSVLSFVKLAQPLE